MLGRVTKNEESKENGERWRERRNITNLHIFFSCCVHLVAIGDVNDRPVSVDQSRRKIQHSRVDIIFK